MIIVEGPDGAGKSTLCLNLVNSGIATVALQSPRLQAKGNVDRMKYETKRYMRLYGNSDSHVVDRYLFSEMAYGPVLRGRSAFSMNEYLETLLEIMRSGSFVIFCLPQKLNYKVDESPVVIEKMPFILPLYEKMFDDVCKIYPRCIKYEWDKPAAYHQLVKFIEENKLER